MEKFYDSFNIIKLIERSLEIEYPIEVLALGTQMHLSIRTLRAYECYEECDAPANGIIAGCLQSNYPARALLFAIMQRHYDKVPRMLLRSFVDDVRQSHAGDPQTITQQCVGPGLLF